ncbi:hexitol phosphatase HxpB [Shewanella subflava]|uniref:Hexitol phosphatase HxpB n=1 Tax=Shewanella subflava TaxID=2986476 RepID=A0ABT3I465_9GAMM|nr:hexitol phosphatase HxpB [Shewanella subflava]MCW3170866.1 hexitol phosphatase HxpB [Shewanella subflava]
MANINVKAVIFDMDGVLIDSEPAWQTAEIAVLNRLGLKLTFEDVESTTGYRIDQVVDYWHQRFPWTNYNNAETASHIIAAVAEHIRLNGEPMAGVIDTLKDCRQKGLKVGLATSSPSLIIEAVLTKLGISEYFDAICSAEHLALGKPHPEVYLNCAKKLAVDAVNCLAIEDSFNGLIAARAANMQTIAIPAPQVAQQTKWIIGHHQISHLSAVAPILSAYLQENTKHTQ